MNKRQRVETVVRGGKADRVPACFSLHFPKEYDTVEQMAKAHVDFYRETGCDICKIMNENLVPRAGELASPDDWNKVTGFDRRAPFMRRQLDLIDAVKAALPEDTYYLATLHGICASGIHPFEYLYGYEGIRAMLCKHLREDSRPVTAAFERIADGMADYAAAAVEHGMDGIYYAALGGERHFFTDEEFEKYIFPYDEKILKAIRAAGGTVFLHICKENINMERYRRYAALCDVVNWGVYETNFSLEEGRKLFPGKTLMGGLANRGGVLVDGTVEELASHVRGLVKAHGNGGFILGADCTLPTEIPYGRIAAAVQAAVIK